MGRWIFRVPVDWSDMAFQPGPNLSAELAESWSWLLGDRQFLPFVCSKMGDVFFETDRGEVEWLSCSSGTIEPAATNRTEFEAACRDNAEEVATWFAPGLVSQLHNAGKIAAPDECYAFTVLPVFAECEYAPENLNPVSAREVLLGLSETHRQIHDLPDGTSVQMKIVD